MGRGCIMQEGRDEDNDSHALFRNFDKSGIKLVFVKF